ncbi:hypothetical protein A2Z22_00625 [Candidatus Woesebacteria bacterium RBG_16_34_12]|uniref:YYY membrane protein n=1 Tax=Candidatus Woesebacteria bacterium RBG_16_34_12 TaxID=1802480 RepID=A0A1F7X870_9BACT|nr:MAG: hypothetical protein A2Z22_00625 [Candidatus Woesebacteria bacterium RBG_16_34_12]
MSSDLTYIIWWWFIFFLFGLVSIPLTWLFFRRFIDLGYGFSKTIGLIIVAYFIFLTGISHILPFTKTWLYVVFLSYTTVNYYIFKIKRKEIVSDVLKNIRVLIAQEILFIIGLLFWSYVRAHNPEIRGLEKFMDFGFINSILRSKYLPPTDMWFAGLSINYYWFGHFFVALISKFSNIPSSVTYNLMLATILGLSLMGVFSLSSTLIKNSFQKINPKHIFIAGLLSAILLNFAGNFHTPYYLSKEGRDKYWYPDATRFIGYNPDIDDKTIHEFPIYSYVVADLHAHLINLPFVLLYIALLFNFVSESSNLKAQKSKQFSNINFPIKKLFKTLELRIFKLFGIWSPTRRALKLGKNLEFRISNIIPLGFILGIMFMTSTWDFGNYLLTTGVVIGFFNLKKNGFNFNTIISSAITIGVLLIISGITIYPFLINFQSIAQGVKLVHSHSPLWQLAILWGFPAILTVIFMLFLILVKPKIRKSDLFIFSLHVASWILIILPEIFYVKDIYIASHYRANTMFKLTYQAFVMFYLSAGYIAVRTITLINKQLLKLATGVIFIIIFSLVLIYPSIAINSYYADLKNYSGLNGILWLKKQFPEYYAVVAWFNQNIDNQPVVLEAPGDSYTDFNVISSYTGLPTVSGWFVHEWLWRGDASFPQARVTDINQIYTSNDINLSKSLLKKYKVEYVIIGSFERQKFPTLNEARFQQLGQLVFSSGNTKVYKLN